jgi:serine/threonine protein phosphatase 1
MNAAGGRAPQLVSMHGVRRVWAIGAIHGEAQRLARLHDAIGERFIEGDRVVYLGDILGYGAAVLAAIDELLDFRRRVIGRRRGLACHVVVLRGAQEEMWQKLLQLQFAVDPAGILRWMADAGVEATLRAYGGDLRQGLAAARAGPRTLTRWTSALQSAVNSAPGHRTLLSALRHAAFTEERRLLFVHAAVDPARPLEKQGDAFWWGRRDILALGDGFDGFRRIVRGSDPQRRGLVESRFAVSLDGGAGRGGRLVAACFDPEGTVLDRLEA